jgi:hypothetical protein
MLSGVSAVSPIPWMPGSQRCSCAAAVIFYMFYPTYIPIQCLSGAWGALAEALGFWPLALRVHAANHFHFHFVAVALRCGWT